MERVLLRPQLYAQNTRGCRCVNVVVARLVVWYIDAQLGLILWVWASRKFT